MVAYQAQLDRVKNLAVKPEANPVLGVQSGWDRTDLIETARKEIDTMVNLKGLIESTKEPILRRGPDARRGIDHAPWPQCGCPTQTQN